MAFESAITYSPWNALHELSSGVLSRQQLLGGSLLRTMGMVKKIFKDLSRSRSGRSKSVVFFSDAASACALMELGNS